MSHINNKGSGESFLSEPLLIFFFYFFFHSWVLRPVKIISHTEPSRCKMGRKREIPEKQELRGTPRCTSIGQNHMSITYREASKTL